MSKQSDETTAADLSETPAPAVEQTSPSVGAERVKYWKATSAAVRHSPRVMRRTRSNQSRSRLVEWHTLTPEERSEAWHGLLSWVTWLHDRYELSIESRLPRCWAQHPGLIEELWALKVWREEIYSAKESSGQAARYWHAELRQTVHAAATFYAAGCRSGHKATAVMADANPELVDRWASGDPLGGVPAGRLLASQIAAGWSSGGTAQLLKDDVMREHVQAGRARYISKTMRDAIHLDGSWWYPEPAHPGFWRRNVDPEFSKLCDRRAAKLAAADAAVAQRQQLRRVLAPTGPEAESPAGRAEPRTTQAGD